MNNTEKMLTLIAARPLIRTVEIADIIDCDADQVQPALQSRIDSADLILVEITAPNGRPANAFRVTGKFAAGELYARLLPDIEAQRAADRLAHPERPPEPAPAAAPRAPHQSMVAPGVQRAAAARPVPAADVDVAVFAKHKTPAPAAQPIKVAVMSKIDGAIQFVRENGGRVGQTRMKQHLGLASGTSPVSWLATALRDGRLARDGTDWLIGDGKPAKEAAPPATEAPREIVAALAPAPAASAPPPAQVTPAPRFRWAAWSDGSIEIERDGQRVLTLSPDECVQLAPAMVQTTMAVAQ